MTIVCFVVMLCNRRAIKNFQFSAWLGIVNRLSQLSISYQHFAAAMQKIIIAPYPSSEIAILYPYITNFHTNN